MLPPSQTGPSRVPFPVKFLRLLVKPPLLALMLKFLRADLHVILNREAPKFTHHLLQQQDFLVLPQGVQVIRQ
jgi:hypothetical protein